MKTKHCFSIILINLFFSVYQKANAQAPAWDWARSSVGSGDIQSHSVAADGYGNVYSTGWYYNTDVTFGSATLNYSGDGDIFVVKYDAAGNVVWANGAGGTGFDEPRSVAVDASGSVYVAGIFDGPALTFGSTTLVNADSTTIDMFIVKYDSTGNVLWAKSAGGIDREFAESIAIDFAGNVYVSGSFEGVSLSFDAVVITNVNPATEDIFVVKYDSDGNALWAKSGNGNNLDWATCVTTDPFGNVFIAGPFYSDTLVFDGTLLVNPFSSLGCEEIFIVKYDSSGNVAWVKEAIGNGYFNEPYSLASDAFGSVFVTGVAYSDTVTFDGIILTNPLAGYNDMILAKYDSAGNVLWAKKTGGYSSDYGYSVTADASGNAYVVGYFDSDTIHFDAVTSVTINPVFYSDLFLVKYDASGNVAWAKSTGGIYQPSSWGFAQQGIASDGAGNIYTVGSFNFDTLAFDSDTLFLGGSSSNVFLAKLNDAGACAATFGLFPDSATQHLYWALNQATGVAPISYLWNWGDGSFDTIAYPSHTYAVGGFYTICLTITDSAGCTNSVCHTSQLQRNAYSFETANTMVQVNVVAALPTGFEQNQVPPDISVYPNPAFNNLSIQNNSSQPIQFSFYNSLGERIISKSLTDKTSFVDLSGYPGGIYFYKLTSDKTLVNTGKIIKQ
ncbi:MAG TPA: SBBP repeat-containing protein [Bacteroidia bacterium]|nr:SBBP repeat-containing protein [Bacteroidia bacterium]